MHFVAGTFLGNPVDPSERVWVDRVTQPQLASTDSQTDASSLAGALAHLLFTPEELATQNATPARTQGVGLLDAQRLTAIRGLSTEYVLNGLNMAVVCRVIQ